MPAVPAGPFPALFVAEPDGTPARLADARAEDLGEGDVVVEVAWSALNYKDGLALTGSAPVVRRFPMIGGIDLAGLVHASDDDRIRPGDAVVVAGSGLGEEHPGGYAAFARVPADWCVLVPAGLTLRSAAAIGTAGLTAMLALNALEREGSTPRALGELPLVVTGATGGVGAFAVLLAARLGFRVTASTGKITETGFLTTLGANGVIDRSELAEAAPVALGPVRFGAGIDTVGGPTLANLLRQTRPDGAVVACGLAGGAALELTVHPFILRGVTLAGINSVRPGTERRALAWQRIGELVGDEDVEALATEVDLGEVVGLAPRILAGELRGRTVVRVSPGR